MRDMDRAIVRCDWVETHSIPWQVCLLSKSLVLLSRSSEAGEKQLYYYFLES